MGRRLPFPADPVPTPTTGSDVLPIARPLSLADSSTKEIMFELIRSAFASDTPTAGRRVRPIEREDGKGAGELIAFPTDRGQSHGRD